MLGQFLYSFVAIELDHFLDDLVLGAVQMGVILELSGVVPTLLCDPLLFSCLQIALEVAIVLADNSLGRVVETIADIICSLWNVLKSIDIVTDKSFAVRSEPLHLLRIESPILYSAIVPLLVLELEIIVEEVLARDELSSIPFSNISALQSNQW